MGEFFRGWRKITGCVTLVIACLLMAGWARSLTFYDVIELPPGFHIAIIFESSNGEFCCQIIADQQPNQVYWHAEPLSQIPFVLKKAFAGGPVCGNYIDEIKRKSNLNGVPYGLVAPTLTLISCFLLLSKPRKSNQKKLTEPNRVEGA